jgi:hypothetical protein
MGTRNLTIVKIGGEYKVAQYGQYDGYPEGQGLSCLNFLRNEMQEERFKAMLQKCSYLTEKGKLELIQQYGGTPDGRLSNEGCDAMLNDNPALSIRVGANVLSLVQNSSDGLKLDDYLDFVGDGLFCEWAWVIDFDTRTFEGYQGFNTTPLEPGDRFCKFHDAKSDYYPARLVARFNLDELPDEKTFLAAFKQP